MHPRLPTPLVPCLGAYLHQLSRQLPDVLQGLYLEGSIALAGFNERFSDIDFTAFCHRQLTREEMRGLARIHQVLELACPWNMSGTYYPVDDLRYWPTPLLAQLHYHDGLLREDHRAFDPDSVEGWILQHHGLALMGPPPQQLPFQVDWPVLIGKMHQNLLSYWGRWSRSPFRLLVMLSDWGIQWAVLGVLRQFYSFQQHAITTKAQAGEYGLACLPEHWHPLIREALAIREGKSFGYRLRVHRALEARRFLHYIIERVSNSAEGVP